jgi:phospholipase C
MNSKRTLPKLTINRREFLCGAALLSGTAAASQLLPIGWARERQGLRIPDQRRLGPSILDLSVDLSPVDHIVVLMMENRSFDHYLGWLATDVDYIEQGQSRYGGDFSVDGDNSQVYRDPAGSEVATYHLTTETQETNPYRGCGHPDPGHGWNQGRAQRDGGFLAQGSGNDKFALGYYSTDDLPFYAWLARRFTIFDHYHCSILGPTFPNREYLHSAQSGGNKDNSLPHSLRGFQWPTIWDKLAEAGVPAAYYYSDAPVIGWWGPRLIRYAHRLSDYFDDAARGKLPNVVFLDPALTTKRHNDDHPFADIRAGQKFVFEVVKAFVESPHWNSGCFIITYDEWGGFFDHVPPPILPDDRASANDQENFGQAGFRVPTMLASPYAQPGIVDHRLYDHTSILRFIEWRFLGAPPEGPGTSSDTWYLTTRDRYANNIGASLLPDSFNPDVNLELPDLMISPPCRRRARDGSSTPSSVAPAQPLPEEKHAFDQALEAGFFEAVGYKIDLPSQPVWKP